MPFLFCSGTGIEVEVAAVVALVVAGLIGAGAAGAASTAVGHGFGHHFGHFGGMHGDGGPLDPAEAQEHAEHMVGHLAWAVDATAEQKQKLLAEHKQEERGVARQLAEEFAQRFQEQHGIKIRFTEAAADALVSQALEQATPVRDLCAAKFKDYQFGLKLISQNSGQQEFTLDRDAVATPDKVLSDWVVASYRK